MTLLPIVDRELRVAARRVTTYWVRAGFGLGALAIGAFFYLGRLFSLQSTLPLWQLGDHLFMLLGVLALLYCLLSGVRSTADCLSEEKRNGTLGLLFLTDLKGYDVVLGKVAAASLCGFYGLLGVFPVLALTMLLGGVSHGQFWRMVLVLVNTFLFSQAAGMLISSFSERPRQAMAGTLALLLIFSVAFPVVGLFVRLLWPARTRLAQLVFLPCPGDALYWGCFRFSGGANYFWGSLAVTHGLAWLFLLLAIRRAPHCWQDKPKGAVKGGWERSWNTLRHGDGPRRIAFRRRLLEVNAFYWLAARARLKPAQVWVCLLFAAGLWGWGSVGCRNEWFNEAVYFPTAILLNSMLKLWLTSEAGRRLGEDHHSGALELVLSTTLSVNDILRGQWLALGRQFLKPLIMVLGVECIFLAASLQRESFHDNPLNPVVWIAGMLMLIVDLAALGWVSMWVALNARSPNRITGITVVRLLVAPWILYVALMPVLATIQEANGWPRPTWKFFVGLWFAMGILFDLAFGLTAWWQLRTRFRQFALRRYAPTTSRLRRCVGRGRIAATVRALNRRLQVGRWPHGQAMNR